MKNKVFTTVMLAIIIIFTIQLNVHAVIVSTDKQVESGSGTITISVTSNQALGAYTLRLTDTAGLTLVNAAGGEVSSDKKTITGSSADGTKSLGTYTFNVPTVDKDTTYNIKFSITGMETPSLESVKDETNTAVLTVKAKQVIPTPEPEPEPELKPEPEPEPKPEPTPEQKPENPTTKELEFTSINNKTMYLEKSTNFRSEYKINNSNIIGKLSVGTEVMQIGISKTQSEGYIWSKIIYNGKTGYVINENLTPNKPKEEKPEQGEPTQEPKEEEPEVTTEEPKNDKTSEVTGGLKNLEIEGLSLIPTFSSNVYEYRVIVKENLSELKINAVSAIENATITIAGNQNLQEGENLITIIIYNAKKVVEATYQITANKTTLDLSITDKMLQIGTKEATRNLIIFIAAFVITIIVLIVVLILKHRNNYEYYEEEEEEFIDSDENVENIQNKLVQEEYQEVKREKKKGKHF